MVSACAESSLRAINGQSLGGRMEMRIVITDQDMQQLQLLLASLRKSWKDQHHVDLLEQELDHAHIFADDSMASDVVTMNSRVRVLDLAAEKQVQFPIVFPHHADVPKKMISIIAPIGMALLGCQVGDEIECATPGESRKLRIEEIDYQPEAARVAV
jgi:regulator of nucleoside diphosphate kinase